jgi:hypothetical protein
MLQVMLNSSVGEEGSMNKKPKERAPGWSFKYRSHFGDCCSLGLQRFHGWGT